MNRYDDAIPLVSADLIFHGQTPMVDFHTFYPPLYGYLLSAGFRILGRTILVYRLFAAGLELLLLVEAARFFSLALPCFRRFLPLVLLLFAVASGILTTPVWPGYSMALLGLLAYLRGRCSASRPLFSMFLAGLYTGLSTLIRFNFGVYVIAVIGIDILINDFITAADPPTIRFWRVARNGSALVITFAAINAFFYLAIYGASALALPWQTVRYSMNIMSGRGFFTLRPEHLFLLFLAFPCAWICVGEILATNKLQIPAVVSAAAAAALPSLALLTRHHVWEALLVPAASLVSVTLLFLWIPSLPRAALPLLLFCACLQHYFLSRADPDHSIVFYPAIALTVPFLFCVSDGNWTTKTFLPNGQIFPGLVVATYLMATSPTPLLPSSWLAEFTLRIVFKGPISLLHADGDRLLAIAYEVPHKWGELDDIQDELKAVEFVRRRTGLSQPIYVGSTSHTTSFLNSVRAYWLAERPGGTKYVNLDWATASMPSVQQEIVGDLERNGVNWAILFDGSGQGPFFEMKASSPKTLDEYLATQFQLESQFGRYSILRRRPASEAILSRSGK